jgi:hypothetical protein
MLAGVHLKLCPYAKEELSPELESRWLSPNLLPSHGAILEPVSHLPRSARPKVGLTFHSRSMIAAAMASAVDGSTAL